MSIVNKPNDFSANTTISSSEVNANFDTIYNDYNGGIAAANLASSAVVAAKIATDAVETAKIKDAAVTYAKLLTTIFSGQVSSQANAGTAGGTMYYVNLGGIKLVWGTTASKLHAAGVSTSYAVTLPTSFFTTIQASLCQLMTATGSAQDNLIAGVNVSTTTFNINWHNKTASPNIGGVASFVIIGT